MFKVEMWAFESLWYKVHSLDKYSTIRYQRWVYFIRIFPNIHLALKLELVKLDRFLVYLYFKV